MRAGGIGTGTPGRPPPWYPARGGFIWGRRAPTTARAQLHRRFVPARGTSRAPGPLGWALRSPQGASPRAVTPWGSLTPHCRDPVVCHPPLHPSAPCSSPGSKTGGCPIRGALIACQSSALRWPQPTGLQAVGPHGTSLSPVSPCPGVLPGNPAGTRRQRLGS